MMSVTPDHRSALWNNGKWKSRILRRRMILAPTCQGSGSQWYAILLLAQGWRASATAAYLLDKGPSHHRTMERAAFGEGGPRALIFEQTGGSPPPLARRSGRS